MSESMGYKIKALCYTFLNFEYECKTDDSGFIPPTAKPEMTLIQSGGVTSFKRGYRLVACGISKQHAAMFFAGIAIMAINAIMSWFSGRGSSFSSDIVVFAWSTGCTLFFPPQYKLIAVVLIFPRLTAHFPYWIVAALYFASCVKTYRHFHTDRSRHKSVNEIFSFMGLKRSHMGHLQVYVWMVTIIYMIINLGILFLLWMRVFSFSLTSLVFYAAFVVMMFREMVSFVSLSVLVVLLSFKERDSATRPDDWVSVELVSFTVFHAEQFVEMALSLYIEGWSMTKLFGVGLIVGLFYWLCNPSKKSPLERMVQGLAVLTIDFGITCMLPITSSVFVSYRYWIYAWYLLSYLVGVCYIFYSHNRKAMQQILPY